MRLEGFKFFWGIKLIFVKQIAPLCKRNGDSDFWWEMQESIVTVDLSVISTHVEEECSIATFFSPTEELCNPKNVFFTVESPDCDLFTSNNAFCSIK
ncbi:uncharacterized protein MONOS_12633 [Monocercomonoides exilis]|uniref:uncharacterized protein n=1 Tax=Monocercomonoides exilis TaxID=2049356 RepID=UPI00355A8B2E|nr:hypothetical protein MONOS_12633 [Monocercomonoides exilis]|eukprot:MONOS_12633.1-p1 / transcript=MONOS_12633.1 / gene=MONOS_12633 / organism=Monocercomonoides_exilis_PA203 / gene_product=unspecified product / transcript_product=unspecified product / location=Mono_scaffold00711:24198-24488(+) / protein_length=97 / sequence_SO=supercontig / SO=protein_coding / is_pseudo=false